MKKIEDLANKKATYRTTGIIIELHLAEVYDNLINLIIDNNRDNSYNFYSHDCNQKMFLKVVMRGVFVEVFREAILREVKSNYSLEILTCEKINSKKQSSCILAFNRNKKTV